MAERDLARLNLGYTELRALTDADPVLADAVAGELIESEIEIRSGRCENWGELVARQQDARNQGAQRTNNFNSMRSSPSFRSAPRMRMGGGRRR